MNTAAHKITDAQINTLRTILRHGGAVRPTMGAIVGRNVRKTVLARLEDMGLVRVVAGSGRPGPYEADVEVTAAGCRAVNAADLR